MTSAARTSGAGLRALAVAFPAGVRTNDYWRQLHPALVAQAQQKTLARLWTERATSSPVAEAFDEEMQRYTADPFRGTRERRILAPGETPLTLELRAARRALDAAALAPAEVDLVLAASFLPDQLGVGNATFLAGELGTRGAAFNVESACSGSLVALQTAAALVQAGAYRNVLCVVSCTYSRVTDERDTLSWTVGDGAAAFLVGPAGAGEGLLGASLRHTAVSCGALSYQLKVEDGAPQVRMEATAKAGRALAEDLRDLPAGELRGRAARRGRDAEGHRLLRLQLAGRLVRGLLRAGAGRAGGPHRGHLPGVRERGPGVDAGQPAPGGHRGAAAAGRAGAAVHGGQRVERRRGGAALGRRAGGERGVRRHPGTTRPSGGRVVPGRRALRP